MEVTKVVGRDRVVQLLEWCDQQLRKDLTRSACDSLTNRTKQEVMAAIKKLAAREENIMVARVNLHTCVKIVMNQCNNHVNYTDTIVRDVFVGGIPDAGIQLDLLGDKNQDMTLE